MTKLEWRIDPQNDYAEAKMALFDLYIIERYPSEFRWNVERGRTLASGTATTLRAAQIAAEDAARQVLREELEKLG